jgi:hypothetical protein
LFEVGRCYEIWKREIDDKMFKSISLSTASTYDPQTATAMVPLSGKTKKFLALQSFETLLARKDSKSWQVMN